VTQTLASTTKRHLRKRLAASLIVVGILVAGVVAYQMWWSEPNAFNALGNGMSTTQRVNDLQTLNVDVGVAQSAETVSLRDVEGVVFQNTADAEIEFVICRWKPGLDARLGADRGSLNGYCASTTPASTQKVNLDATAPRAESIILRITPKKAGRIELHGINIEYQRGWRHLWQTGTEHTGPDITITVK
jgi:hypothetical protein